MPALPLPSTRATYFHESRAPRYSLTFALPLWLAYEVLAALIGSSPGSVRNGADVILRAPFVWALGPRANVAFVATLLLAFGIFILRDVRRKGTPKRSYFAWMFLESVVVACLFGLVIGAITSQLLSPFTRLALGFSDKVGPLSTFMVSLGAGLYEELLFRVLFVGMLLFGTRNLLGWGPVVSGLVSVVVGALVFSGFHYLGAYGDKLEVGSFVFRAVAGVAFSGLYVLRGFGIAAWSHALYDVFLLVLGR